MGRRKADGETSGRPQASQDVDAGGSREADRVYADLRTRILTLDLAPGSVFDEAGIVQETGVSRTPVREAVIRLVSEGLLKRDGRQVTVPIFQIAQLRAFFEAMQLLSRVTHRMAAERRDDAALAAILATHRAFEAEAERGDSLAMNDANYRFHLAVSEAADNAFLQESYRSILVQSLRLSRQCFITGMDAEYTRAEHVELILRDHAAICEAIVAGRGADADRLASDHCDLFRNRVNRQLLGPSQVASGIVLDFGRPEEPSGAGSRETLLVPASATATRRVRQRSWQPT